MDKSTKDQIDLKELFGAITIIGTMIDSVETNIKNNQQNQVYLPGYGIVKERLEGVYQDLMLESMAVHQNLFKNLANRPEDIQDEDDE